MELKWVSGAEAPRFVEVTKAFIEKIRQLGPLSQEVTE
jgi:coenzyme F420-reducing hydrogenase delta subunit